MTERDLIWACVPCGLMGAFHHREHEPDVWYDTEAEARHYCRAGEMVVARMKG